MSELPRTHAQSPRELMSALADGQADAVSAADAWAHDPQAREAWYTYHLIGDVMRSDDLAATPRRDADFLATLRTRLAAEPAIVAPMFAPAPATAPRVRRRWAAPAAAAAGFMAVAAVVVTMRSLSPAGEGAPVVAKAEPDATAPVVARDGVAVGDPKFQVVDGQLIRDARLDGYLRAHRGGAAAVPGGAIGRFETVVLER